MSGGLIGVAVAGAAAWYFVSEYIVKEKNALKEYKSTAELLKFISTSLLSSDLPISEIVAKYLSKDGACVSFLKNTFVNGEPGSTTVFSRDKIKEISSNLKPCDEEKLKSLLSDFGRCGIEEERRRVAEALLHFEKRAKEVEAEAQKKIKAAKLLLAAAFISAVILVI